MSRAALLIVSVLVAACSGSKPTCEQVADRMLGLAAERAAARGRSTVGTGMYRKTAEQCATYGWSEDARACLVSSRTLEDLERCREELGEAGAWLAERFVAESQKLDEVDAAKKSGLMLDLPEGASAEIDPSQMSLVLDVGADQTLVQGKVLSDAELESVFRAAFTRNKRTQVIIRAVKGTAHGRVVGIMERAKAAGLTRLAIATTPP